MKESTKRRTANYRHFANTLKTLLALPQEQIYLTDEHMDQLGIRVKKLELDPDTNPATTDKPEYFAPLSHGKLEDLYKMHKPAFELPAYIDPDWTNTQAVMSYRLVEPKTITGLCQPRVSDGYEWRINSRNFTEDEEYPHGIIVSLQNKVPDKEHEFSVTRGELALICKMMMASKERRNIRHEIYPLLLITCHCRKVRIIEAHFDGEFHLKCSPLIDCTSFNQETFELLTRWFMSEPFGNTSGPTQPIRHPFSKKSGKTDTPEPSRPSKLSSHVEIAA